MFGAFFNWKGNSHEIDKPNKASIDDAKELHTMQVNAFKQLLAKYQNFDTSPANEGVKSRSVFEAVMGRIYANSNSSWTKNSSSSKITLLEKGEMLKSIYGITECTCYAKQSNKKFKER